jgi:hypothetical protein
MVLIWACGGDAAVDATRRSNPLPSPSPPGAVDPDADAGATPLPRPDPGAPEPAPYSPPACPPSTSPPPSVECDPLAEDSGCPAGQSCFPFVDYPTSPCEVELYGARCGPAGSGVQGDSCVDSACAADHICVSTGRGTLCARLCGLSAQAPDVCDPGLLCLPIDIEGFGGCL